MSAADSYPALVNLVRGPIGATIDRAVPGPPPTLAELRARREELREHAARYGAGELLVVGSVARGDARSDSDLDLIVDLDPERRGLLELAGLAAALEDLLGCRVDLIAPRFLRDPLPATLLAEAVPV